MKITKSGNWLNEYTKNLQDIQKMEFKNNKIFSFFLLKNSKTFELELENFKPIYEQYTPGEKYQEFEKEKAILLNQFAETDKYGRLKITIVDGQQSYLVPKERIVEYREKEKEILEKYSEVVKEYEIQVNQLMDLLNEPLDIDVHKISYKHIPDEIDISKIRDLIAETDEEIEEFIANSDK